MDAKARLSVEEVLLSAVVMEVVFTLISKVSPNLLKNIVVPILTESLIASGAFKTMPLILATGSSPLTLSMDNIILPPHQGMVALDCNRLVHPVLANQDRKDWWEVCLVVLRGT